jgi:hypothetical protein
MASFFKKIRKGIKKVGRAVGKIAPVVLPIAGTALGGPIGAAIGGAAGAGLGQLGAHRNRSGGTRALTGLGLGAAGAAGSALTGWGGILGGGSSGWSSSPIGGLFQQQEPYGPFQPTAGGTTPGLNGSGSTTPTGRYAWGTQPPPPPGGSFLERIFGGLNTPPDQSRTPGIVMDRPTDEGRTTPNQSGGAILSDVFAGSQSRGGMTDGPTQDKLGITPFIFPAALALGLGYLITRP